MAIQRWDPFEDMVSLRDAMERLLQESFVRPAGSLFSPGRGALPLDLAEDDNSYTVTATMPGVKPDDVKINIHGDTLTIHGESRTEEKQERQNWIMRERRAVSFHRSVTLPGPVNEDQAEARYDNGVLTLTLPKAERAKPKQIKVQSGQGQLAGSNQPSPSPAGQTGTTNDRVNQASEQSFPASDAPAYGSRQP